MVAELMRPGQSVSMHADAFDRDWKGTVENLPGAAGTLFSLLPPENASGNFVNVVQRLPVRIRIDLDQVLGTCCAQACPLRLLSGCVDK